MHAADQRVRASPASQLSEEEQDGERLAGLLGWMAGQDFETLLDSGLLKDVEEIVVATFLEVHAGAGRPAAYRWLRYEDPDPVERLAEGARKLIDGGAYFSAQPVDKACAKASKLGYLN
jgi:hypothetical protein